MIISALVDGSTSALLALSGNPAIITFLARSMEAEDVHAVNLPRYMKEFPLVRANPATYPEWTWNVMARTFSPTRKELLTDRLRQDSALAVFKERALGEMCRGIAILRMPVWRNVIMQEAIYMTKKLQAQKFKDAKYSERNLSRYPYVLEYAELSGLAPRAAADEILFKAQLDDEVLCKSETLRMKYFNLMKKAKTEKDAREVLKAFHIEGFGSPL